MWFNTDFAQWLYFYQYIAKKYRFKSAPYGYIDAYC